MTYEIRFADQSAIREYALIPADLRQKLDAHFRVIAHARSLRNLPYPAHANRGVTVRESNYEMNISLHVARTGRSGEIEVLGVRLRVLSDSESYTAVVMKSSPCPNCGSGKGDPCRVPSQWKYKKVHAERIKLHERATVREVKVNPADAVANAVCPNCGSGVGKECRTPSGWIYKDAHAERLNLYRRESF